MYYRGSAAAVIVYDITKLDSFQTLKKWVKELKEHGPEDIVVAIAGNKNDLGDIREVPMKEAKEFAESISAIFIETSARNSVNIEALFQKISKQIPPLENTEVESNESFKLSGTLPAPARRRGKEEEEEEEEKRKKGNKRKKGKKRKKKQKRKKGKKRKKTKKG
uniref:Uncharacterized protein n=1 Tax=Knipowitschia caucasica TaxID=637954 RepID=A0AAV2JV57_KNICA